MPRPGACGGQFTANTMSTVLEFLGLSPAGFNGVPAEDPLKDDVSERTGELVMDLVRHDRRPSAIVDRRSIENAIASISATGGSTNGVLHMLAIAREFDIPLTIDEFGEVADRTPIVADMMPGGRYAASDMYDAGGVALVMRELLKRPGLLMPMQRPSTGGPSARSPPPPRRRRDSRSSGGWRRRSSRPAAWPSCAARSHPRAVS